MGREREFDVLFYLMVPSLIIAVAIGHAFIASLLRLQYGVGAYAAPAIVSAVLGLLFAYIVHRIGSSGKKMLEASLAGSVVISLVYGYQRSIFDAIQEMKATFAQVNRQTGTTAGNGTAGGLGTTDSSMMSVFGPPEYNPEIAFFTAFLVFNIPFVYYLYQRGIGRRLYLPYLGIPVIYGATVLALRLFVG